MKYRANPVVVDAQVITKVEPIKVESIEGVAAAPGQFSLTLDSGEIFVADQGMVARYVPEEGDYLVTQEDGYKYLNPKAVFERKYSPVDDAGSETESDPDSAPDSAAEDATAARRGLLDKLFHRITEIHKDSGVTSDVTNAVHEATADIIDEHFDGQ